MFMMAIAKLREAITILIKLLIALPILVSNKYGVQKSSSGSDRAARFDENLSPQKH